MAYLLRQSRRPKGIYLQIYFNYYDPAKKAPRARYVRSLSYIADLQASGIEDPVS